MELYLLSQCVLSKHDEHENIIFPVLDEAEQQSLSLCAAGTHWFLFVAEIVRAMTFVIEQGMAMYWGTSRWNVVEIMVTQLTAVRPPQLYSELVSLHSFFRHLCS